MEEEKFLNKHDDQEMPEKCDEKDHEDHDSNWIAKNITDLMSHLLQGYDRRIRPFFESKTLLKSVHVIYNDITSHTVCDSIF